MRVKLREPVNSRYFYFNVKTNTIYLMVPVTTGTEIGLDTTCKTVLALQEFFGKRSDSAQLENSARHELIRYKKALEDDLILLPHGEATKVRERLAQVKKYIDTLARIEAHPSLNALSGGHPVYPQPVKDLLAAAGSNLYSMRLRPRVQDGMLNSQNPIFTMDRNRANGTFFHALWEIYPKISKIKKLATHKEKLLQQVMLLLGTPLLPATVKVLLPLVVTALTSSYQAQFKATTEFSMDTEELGVIAFQQDEKITDIAKLREFAEAIIDSKNYMVSIFPIESPFIEIGVPIDVDKLSIMTQFLMAEINFYAHSHHLSKVNFGQVLDTNYALALELANAVKTALENGLVVEQAVGNFLNQNRRHFDLSQALSVVDLTKITQRFAEHYKVIKESPHFDEFMVLDHDHQGRFFAHQGSICFDFADLMHTKAFEALAKDARYLRPRNEVGDLPVVLPGREADAIASIEVDQEAMKEEIIAAIYASDYTTLSRHLLSSLEEGGKVFEMLGRDFFRQFDKDVQIQALFITVRSYIRDAAISNSFNRIVRGQEVQLLLTPAMARSLYVATVSSTSIPLEMTLQYSTRPAIEAILKHLGMETVTTVTAGLNGNFVIDTTQFNVETLQHKLDSCINAIHLTPSMAQSLEKQVADRYGEGSAEYLGMKALSEGIPQIIRAMALLDITTLPENFSRPNNGNGSNGYIVQGMTDDSFRIIHEVHAFQANRLELSQKNADALYQAIRRLAPFFPDYLRNLTNEFRPAKLEAALLMLGIEFGRIEFNDIGEFRVYLSEAEQAKVKFLANIPLSSEEISLIPGYRPQVEVPDSKSARGYLFFDILHPEPLPPEEAEARQDRRRPITVEIEKVRAFRAAPIPEQINANQVELNCPAHILLAFQRLLSNSGVLGTNFLNPYTKKLEQFPADASLLTARHLQILARNEEENYNGKMKTKLYHKLLSDNEIATIRCLVKANTVAGITYATHSGGYPSGHATRLSDPQKTIVVDQPTLQWLGDLRNIGGIFFYPNAAYQANLPLMYTEWQNSSYHAMFGLTRPECPAGKVINVVWNGIGGQIDLNGVAYCIEKEFEQALDAVVSQGKNLSADEQINFMFLKSGTGHSLRGLNLGKKDTVRLEEARLKGILQALKRSSALQTKEEKVEVLGKIGRIELPYCGNIDSDTIQKIKVEIEALGLQWGGAADIDAYKPRPGFVNATTTCSVVHAMVGNGGRNRGISAAFAANSYLDHLNPGFNTQMTLRQSPWLKMNPAMLEPIPFDPKKQSIIDKLQQLIVNITEKRNERAGWFTLNTNRKVEKLQAILDWLNTNELIGREFIILAVIRDVCSIKRNYLGFHTPHSALEFKQLLSEQELAAIKDFNFTAKNLNDLGRKPEAFDELLNGVDCQRLALDFM